MSGARRRARPETHAMTLSEPPSHPSASICPRPGSSSGGLRASCQSCSHSQPHRVPGAGRSAAVARGSVAASAGLASVRPEPDVPLHCAPRALLSPSESQTRQGACCPAQLPRPNRARTRTITHLGCPLRRRAVCEHPAVHPSHHRASRMCLYLHTLHSTARRWHSASQCHPSVTALSS